MLSIKYKKLASDFIYALQKGSIFVTFSLLACINKEKRTGRKMEQRREPISGRVEAL